MKKGFLMGILLGLVIGGSAQEYQDMDRFALDLDRQGFSNYSQVAVEIRDHAQNQIEIARGIYMWLIANVSWDLTQVDNWLASGDRSAFTPSDPDYVFENGIGVCSGFARLFQAMAEEAGLQAEVIPGYIKGAGDYYQGRLEGGPSHVWNTVLVDSAWYVVDAAMGQTHGNPDFYFFPDPEKLIRFYFPVDSQWQLLGDPVSREEFEAGAAVYAGFFEYRIDDLQPNAQILRLNPGESAQINISCHRDVWIEGAVMQNNQRTAIPVVSTQDGELTTSVARFDQVGHYALMLFARSRTRNTGFELVVLYNVYVE